MAATKKSFRAALEKLVRRFESDKVHYLSTKFSEAQARVDFITPFFKALGWDVENEQGLPHHAREAVVEITDDAKGRPDYAFRVSGQTKFFVEAKAPSEELDAARHIVQAKSYAWSTKQVLFVVLTDFEEFRFYDASIQPDERRPDEGLLLKLKFAEYLANIDRLWEFSRERVLAGSLEAMLPRDRRTQRLRIPVDEAFLDEMTGWREDLAKNIYKHNQVLTAKQLNEIVQRLLDRIVFVRIAEDRHVIEKNQLRDVVEEWRSRGDKIHIFEWLNDLFRRINEDFNGEIFKPHLSEEIRIDSDVLAHIIERLYPPKSPYRFDVMGVELLGSIYERYLGKTIHTTPRQVRVEDKPEVRKAGGVYYTPKYIVDYIVKETVGKIIKGRTPKQIEKIRIIDPACGSGSFLIGAFQCLIEYHVRYLTEHPKEAQGHALFPDIIQDANGEPRLSVVRKAEILRNNLFGVDIDAQAVEITMMSLYLKALDGERSQLPPKHHLLPELKYNIICGNSLIGPEISKQGTFFGDLDTERINAFNWNAAFSEIMKTGGFDAVIGNPPYIRIQALQEWAPVEVEFYKRAYPSASTGNYDLYVVFVEKGLTVLKKHGSLGFILPHKFFNSKYGKGLRELISNGNHLREIVHFQDQQIFEGATNYTCLLFLSKDGQKEFLLESVSDLLAWRESGTATRATIPASHATGSEWNFTAGAGADIFAKLGNMSTKLGDVAENIFQGLVTSADAVYLLDPVGTGKSGRPKVRSSSTEHEYELETGVVKPLCKGSRDIRRYSAVASKAVLFPYDAEQSKKIGSTVLISPKDFETRFPRSWNYLNENREILRNREDGKMKHEGWYGYVYPKSVPLFAKRKIITPSIAANACFTLDAAGDLYFVGSGGGGGGGYGIILRETRGESYEYILGLLNSRLLDFFLQQISSRFRGGYFAYSRQYIERLPIRTIDFSNPSDKSDHKKMVTLVNQILDLNKRKLSPQRSLSEIRRLEREIEATDAEIEDLVFNLYGITEKERRIIEEIVHE